MIIRRALFSIVCSLLLIAQTGAAAEMVSVVGDDINMRSGPGTNHEILWKIDAGFPLEIISTKGEWLQVKDFEDSTGWVHSKTTQRTPHMIVKANKGSDQQINVRSEPSTESPIVAKASYGVVFESVEKKDGWVKVAHGQGVSGWVDSRLLWGF